MPYPFANDVLGLIISLLLGIPIVALPGYFLGTTLNLFQFDSQSINTKWSLSVLFGVALTPILLYLPGRLLSTTATWAVLGAMILAGMTMALRHRAYPSWRTVPGATKAAVAIWVIIASASLLDFTDGSRLYPSSAIIDLSYRSQVVAALSYSHGLPPTSFFFFPGHEVPFHYHYLLFLIPAAFVKIGHGLITARIALAAAIVWTGFGLLALVSAYIQFFSSIKDKQRATRIGWFLLLVGGLDLIPFAAELTTRIVTHRPDIFLLPDIEWWNRFAIVSSWYDSIIWQAHHVSGLIACSLGVLLLWYSQNLDCRQQLLSAVGAALAFASGTGTSILVTSVFVALLLIVTIELLLNSPAKSVPLFSSGAVALLLLVPFLQELRSSSAQNVSASFSFAVRPFFPATLLLRSWNIHSPLLWNLTFLLLLPLNYLIELGGFFVAGAYWLLERNSDKSDVIRKHLMLGLMLVSFLLSSFIYLGSDHSNDFGYRALLPAQFILLLWTIEIVEQYWPSPSRLEIRRGFRRQVLAAAIGVGLLTNIANFLLMRSRVAIAERSSSPAELWPPGTHPAELMFEMRSAYSWIRDHSQPGSVVQQNPDPYMWIEKKQYSERMAAVQGSVQDSRSGGSKVEFEKTLRLAQSLFAPGMEIAEMQETCATLKVNYVIVQDSDPIWQDHSSYVWRMKPSFAATRVRLFDPGITSSSSAPAMQ